MGRRANVAYFLFCVPALLVYLLLWVVPALGNVFVSLLNWSLTIPIGSARFVGLSNYAHLIRDPLFWNALRNNAVYGLATVVVITASALLLALLVERAIRWGRGLFRTVLFIPVILPWVVVSFLWAWLYDPALGVIDVFLKAAGLKAVNWLGDPRIALYSLIVVGVWKSAGFFLIIFIAGLQGVPQTLEDAAYIDGASGAQTFFRVVLPILRPIVGVVITLGDLAFFLAAEQGIAADFG